MNIKRLAGIAVGIIILMMLFMFLSCSSTYDAYSQSLGSCKQSQEASKLFKKYQYHPDYKYYYAGVSINYPEHIVGIHNDYLIEKTSGRGSTAVRWIEFETTPKNLEILVKGIGMNGKPYGAELLDHTGKQVGIIYTFEELEFIVRVRVLEDNLIIVQPRFYVGNISAPTS